MPPRFEVYRAVSRQIHTIFAHYTPLIEPLSLEATRSVDVMKLARLVVGIIGKVAARWRQRVRSM
jgi:DNA polymerase-4